MTVIISPTLAVWCSIAVVFLHTGHLCRANTTEVTTTGSYSTDNPSSDTGNKNISLAVLMNDTVTLNCSFDDNSEKQILWWFNDNILFSGKVKLLQANARVEVNAKSSYLFIEGFKLNNTGLYKCRRADNEPGLFAYLYIKRPIKNLTIVLVNGSLTSSINVTVDKNKTYLFRCFGDEPSYHPFIWKIDNKTVDAVNIPSFNRSSLSDKDGTEYNYSELLLHVQEKIQVITCQTGNHSTSIFIGVDSGPPSLVDFTFYMIVLGVSALIVLFLGSVCYCAFTCGRRKDKKQLSCRSSIYSMPSVTSNDHADSNDHCRSRVDGDGMSRGDRGGMRDIEKMKRGNVTENLSPFDLEYVDPNSQHSTTDTYNTFERNLNKYGLQLHSPMSKDDLNEFWEASLCGGSFNERIIVRSLSGKATVDLLEEFRKFMMSLQELPHHPNIWSVHGISKEKLPYRICYEYHDQATVRDYLLGNFQSHEDSDSPYNQTQTLVVLAYQIVDAMVFLKSYAFDHVAIRTEKILLDHTEDCKLYDFSVSSQSHQIALNACRENQLLPWLAPELIFLEEYNQWTDIWAYGVVLWELWCGGRVPHCGKSRENLEKDLRNQQFLVQPPNCPGAVYSLMLSCWKNNASERKMFTDLKKDIENLKTATESSWYGPEDYSTVGSSSFYTVLDNNYNSQ